MVFNSLDYLFFFLGVVVLYFATPASARWIVVLVASYFFYYCWQPLYLILLFCTTCIDWSLAIVMHSYHDQRTRRLILALGVVLNLATLAFFKYFNFFSETLTRLFAPHETPLLVEMILPIGISFYTFQSIAYMVDVYRGELPPERNFGRYAAFVSFFPHLVSGPILKPANIIPQLREAKRWSHENAMIGLTWIATGLVKKVIIADRLSVMVAAAYGNPSAYSGATLLVATYFFAFQIYCDFSGYTDIAIGSARILGYKIPDNFMQPYFSASVTEFWRRWHISLSSWLREYLYIPLGGNRRGTLNTYRNLMITMVLGGLWHGAAWTFVVWGFLQGGYLAIERFLFSLALPSLRAPAWLRRAAGIVVTFNLICLGWIFFRADSFAEAFQILRAIGTNFGSLQEAGISFAQTAAYALLIAGLVAFDYFDQGNALRLKIATGFWATRWALAYAVIFAIIFFGIQSGPQFIYFQF